MPAILMRRDTSPAVLLDYSTALRLCCTTILFLFAGTHGHTQDTVQEAAQSEPQEPSLLAREPFDQIILSEANGGTVLEVFPLELPQRPIASVPKEGVIQVRLLRRPLEDFEVSWKDVAAVRTYEELLFEEAKRLVAEEKFDEAFDYFSTLQASYSELPGLAETIDDYLRRNALALYQDKKHDRAMAVLLSLAARNPTFPGLASAVDAVAGEMIEEHLRRQDYGAARAVLDLWQTQFKEVDTKGSAAWQNRFETAAGRQVAEALQLIQKKDYIAARSAAGRALRIWPKLEAAKNGLARIQTEFPFVTVAVFETSPREPRPRLDNWASLRTGRLLERRLVEQVGFGAEGGIYESPYGDLVPDESGLRLSLRLNPAAPAGDLQADRLVRYLLEMCDPESDSYRSELASVLAGVSIAAGNAVQLDWIHPHVRPEALLQVPPPASSSADSSARRTSPFQIAKFDASSVQFSATNFGDPSRQPRLRTIIEQTFADEEAALTAFLAGEIDVLERVPPWQVERLRAVPGVEVDTYRLPTLHALVPNFERPLMTKREFRRALCFGTQRDWIVSRLLLGGTEMAGFEVISGPFPAGESLGDPIRYAYNNRLTPRPFEPRLAAILATVAWSNVLDPEGKGEIEYSEIPELILAHPSDPLIRLACQTMREQLVREGIPIKLVEFSADELASGTVEYDLRYAELAVWEPVVDARRILGAGGLVKGAQTPYLDAALRRLDDASNWKDVRTRLAEIHEIAHHDLPIVPLWQTENYFAFRTTLSGVGESPVVLYQNIDEWTTSPAGNLARSRDNN